MKIDSPANVGGSRWKRPLRLIFVVFTLLAVLVALLPYALVGLVRKEASRELSRKLGTPVRIEKLRFGWFSGFELEDVEVGNPKGFDATRPALRIEHAHADIALLPLLRGQFGIDSEVRGLHVRIEQTEDGRTNLEELARAAGVEVEQTNIEDASHTTRPSRSRSTGSGRSPGRTDGDLPATLQAMRIHLALADSSIEIRRAGDVLESIAGVTFAIEKDAGSQKLRLRFGAELRPTSASDSSGAVALELDANLPTQDGTLRGRANKVDLARWQPLLASMLGDQAIEAFEGLVDGNFEMQFVRGVDEEARTDGKLTVVDLHVAGPLFDGWSVRAERIVLQPGFGGPAEAMRAGANDVENLLPATHFDFGLEARGLSLAREDQDAMEFAAVRMAIAKQSKSPKLQLDVEAATTPDATSPEGALRLRAEIESATKRGRGVLELKGLQLARLRSLLRTAPDATPPIETLEGLCDGMLDLEIDLGSARRFDLAGKVSVVGPNIAGPALQGTRLSADRWLLQPSLRAYLPDLDGKPRIELGRTSLDLGFATVQCLDEEARKQKGLGEDVAGACTFSADLTALARLGGPFAELAGTTGRTTGTLLLPTQLLRGEVDAGLDALRNVRGLRADATLDALSWSGHGLHLQNAGATATLRDGIVEVQSTETTALDEGPLQLRLRADVNQPESPFELSLHWSAGKVDGEAAQTLAYLVPLLAGLDGEAASFKALASVRLGLRGNAWPQDDQNALQWLDGWQGDGELTLSDGVVTPAPSLAPLLALLGQPQRLALDRLHSAFTLRQGAITHRAMKWLSDGAEYGLTGKARLDGTVELAMDLTPLLARHKDGKLVAGFLAGQPLQATMSGTVKEPKFAAPDLGTMVQKALQSAPRQLLEQQGQELLLKGLKGLLKNKKSDGTEKAPGK